MNEGEPKPLVLDEGNIEKIVEDLKEKICEHPHCRCMQATCTNFHYATCNKEFINQQRAKENLSPQEQTTIIICALCGKEKTESHKCGRPSEYNLSYIGEVDVYLRTCYDEYNPVLTGVTPKGNEYYGRERLKVNIPTIEGFAQHLGVSKKSLYNWAEKDIDFLHALEKIEDEQKKRLIAKGLSGEYNSTIAKLILSANHNMREKSDIESGGKPINISFDSAFKND